MNIFYVNKSPQESAKFLMQDRKRACKMILETAQILCSALYINGMKSTYKPTHLKHPCVIWAAKNRENYTWLLRYFGDLWALYLAKYEVNHKSGDLFWELTQKSGVLPKGEFTTPPNCAKNKKKGLDFSSEKDITKAYRIYLKCQWRKEKKSS